MTYEHLAQVEANKSPMMQVGPQELRGASQRDDRQMTPTANECHVDLHRPCPTIFRVHRSLR